MTGRIIGRIIGHNTALAGFIFAVCFTAQVARAEIDFKFGGVISSDIRYRLGGDELPAPYPAVYRPVYPSQYQLLKNGFSRNENLIKAQLSASISGKVKAVADVDFYTYGFSDLNEIDNLTLRERVDPYRFEANAAYIDIYKVVKGLDLRIGRQVVVWGAADKFNPTSNVSTLDFSDPLLFGKALGNNMLRADWNPLGDWILTGIFVPIFRPSQLPRTAPIALLDPYRPLSIQGDDQLAQTAYFLGTTVYNPKQINVFTQQPEPSIANAQFAFRLGGRVLGQDVSLSYYHGRFGFPVPAVTDVKSGPTGPIVDVGLVWPRMDVIGADIAGTIPKLAGMGYWIEGAVFVPQQVNYALYNDLGMTHIEDRFEPHMGNARADIRPLEINGEGLYTSQPAVARMVINDRTPFLKLTVGGDLSIGSHAYVNLQYVHGFFDEFGAGYGWRQSATPRDPEPDNLRKEQRIGDYLVAGLDFKMLSDTLLFRFFGVLKVPSIDFATKSIEPFHPTAVLFPQLAYQVWDATELTVGGFLFLGDRSTKFGDPAAGASEVFGRVKFTY